MNTNHKHEDLKQYRTLGLPLLALMGLLGVAGILITVALKFIF